ncbi:hypothetical protein DRO58_01775 [Candidatus Bathyarchaeota archaeon]|nr:MAG: hypothetical protein DRO58_01775 [Candidatus Bathyarchaeota archaeon]
MYLRYEPVIHNKDMDLKAFSQLRIKPSHVLNRDSVDYRLVMKTLHRLDGAFFIRGLNGSPG